MTKDTIIKASALSHAYAEQEILHELDFEIKRGELLSFVGPSGCGKSTLLNLIAQRQEPSRGEVLSSFKNISFMFQEDSLLSWKNVISNVSLPFDLRNKDTSPALGAKDEVRAKALDLLKTVGLTGYESFFPSALSGGMKKRVELARALISETDLLILDEPFSNLDIMTRERLNLLISKLHSESDITIILVTHSIEEAVFLSNRVFLLSPTKNNGSSIILEEEISPREVQKNYQLSPAMSQAEHRIRKQIIAQEWRHSLPRPDNNKYGASKNKPREKQFWWLVPIELVTVLIFLSLLKYFAKIEDVFYPYPLDVAKRFVSTLIKGSIWQHISITLFESFGGFLISFFIALISAYLIAKSKLASRILMPWFIVFHTIPMVALAPFLVVWLGFGYPPRLAVVIMIVFFPALINNITAIRDSDERVKNLIDFYRPSRLKTLVQLEIPGSLPVIFSGIKISISVSVIGAVVGEFVSGSTGLGVLLSSARAHFDMDLMFVALVWLIIISMSYYGLAVWANLIIKRIYSK